MSTARVTLQYLGEETYRGADEFYSESITAEPGDMVDVSPQKAELLLKGKETESTEMVEEEVPEIKDGQPTGKKVRRQVPKKTVTTDSKWVRAKRKTVEKKEGGALSSKNAL